MTSPERPGRTYRSASSSTEPGVAATANRRCPVICGTRRYDGALSLDFEIIQPLSLLRRNDCRYSSWIRM
jgi:hypothetical protein